MSSRLIFLYCFAGVYGKDLVFNLGPNDYNHHPLEVKTLTKDSVEPTKNGPVLFPNDGPPPPKTPLIVTSRPLTESIARSELNPETHHKPAPKYHDKGRINHLRFLKKKRPKIGIIHARKFTDPHVQDGSLGSGRGFYPGSDSDQSSLVLINHVSGKPLYDYDQSDPQRRVFVERKDINNMEDGEHRLRLPAIYKVIGQFPLESPRFKIKGEKAYAVNSGEAENHIHNNDDENANYAFSYKVKDQKTGDDFSHTQRSRGSATNGEYRVRLPDGRMQIVSYTADENGYKADVRYDKADDPPGKNRRVKDRQNEYSDNFLDYNQVHYDDYTSPSHNGIDGRSANTYQVYGNKDILYTSTNDVRTEKIDESIFNYPDQKKADNEADRTDDDYEIDYDDEGEYDAHKGKFGKLCKHKNPYLGVIMVPSNEQQPRVTTLSPLIQGLKGLFTAIRPDTRVPDTEIPIKHTVPSTTAKPLNQQRIHSEEEENVVHIGGKNLYTNIQTSLPFLRKITQFQQHQQQVPITTEPEPTPHNYPVNYTPYYIFPTNQPIRHHPYYIFPTATTTVPTTTTTRTPYYIFPNIKPYQQSYTTINPHHEEEPHHGSQVHQDQLLDLYERVPTTTDTHQRVPTTTYQYQKVPTTTAQPFQRFPTTTEQYQKYPTRTPQFQTVSTTLYPRPTIASIGSTLDPSKNIDFSSGKPMLTSSFIDRINKYLSFK